MGTLSSKLLTTGLFFLFILASGFWLSRSGRPINSLILTVHKLIGLGSGIYLVLAVNRVRKASGLSGNGLLGLIVTLIIFLGIVATGGLLSTENEWPEIVTRLHHILPYLAVFSTGGTLYILFSTLG